MMTADALVAELEPLTHVERMVRMVDLGRRAGNGDEDAGRLIDELADGSTYRRLLALQTVYGSRDGTRAAAALTDPSRLVRHRGAKLVALVCSDDQAGRALASVAGHKLRRRLAGNLLRRGRHPAVDLFMREAMARDGGLEDTALIDLMPLCSDAVIAPYLDALLERASGVTWSRLTVYHPKLAADALGRRLEQARNIDPRLRWHIHAILPALARHSPDHALSLTRTVLERGEDPRSFSLRQALVWLIRRRPAETFDLLHKHDRAHSKVKPPGSFSGLSFTRVAHRLGAERLAYLVERAPGCLADGFRARRWLLRLSRSPSDSPSGSPARSPARSDDGVLDTVLQAWLERGKGSWGAYLFRLVSPDGDSAELREKAYKRWSRAARDQRGIIPLARLHPLPRDLRQRESKRHLERVRALASQPLQRLTYAALLPFAEARDVLQSWLGHPEGEQRAAAHGALLATVTHEPERMAEALEHVHARRFEQDPVRMAMLQALAALPVRCFQTSHLEAVSEVIQDALDAADLSYGTAAAATSLVVRLFRVDAAWGATWLTRLLEARGSVSLHGLGDRLTAADVERFAPAFRELVEHWSTSERAGILMALAQSLGIRLKVATPLLDALETLARDLPFVAVAGTALDLLRRHAYPRFAALVPEILGADESFVLLPEVARHLSVRRQDLLSRVLLERPVRGRFATGKTRWVLHFGGGHERWTPSLQARQVAALGSVLANPKLDTPNAFPAIHTLAALAFVPATHLIELASDPRQPVREIAVRSLPRLDGGEGVPTLLDCLGDGRARWAIYALRRAFADMTAGEIIAILRKAPLGKVTVAKEVMRLLGDMGGQAAYGQLLEFAADPELHRDVRIALLRALWNHLEADETWPVFARAAADPDWVVASRLADIPTYRLSRKSEERLAGLLVQVLQHPAAEARQGLLTRLAHLPLRDSKSTLFNGILAHMTCQDDTEVGLAFGAVLGRLTAGQVDAVTAQVKGLFPRRRTLVTLLETLGRYLGPYRGKPMRRLGERVLDALADDPLNVCRYLELAPRILGYQELAAALQELSRRGLLHADAMVSATAAVRACSRPGALEEALASSKDGKLRRLALTALTCAAAPERGWTQERRTRLERYRKDKDPLVAGAAAYIFPAD